MPTIDRRNALRAGLALTAVSGAAVINFGCSPQTSEQDNKPVNDPAPAPEPQPEPDPPAANKPESPQETSTMKIQYLEFVTTDVDGICELYSKVYGVTFADPDVNLGGARAATMADGSILGVRAPMRETEEPVVRPYMLVDDIDAAVKTAAEAGAEIAMPPTPIPGQGKFAIVIQGGIQSGMWQV